MTSPPPPHSHSPSLYFRVNSHSLIHSPSLYLFSPYSYLYLFPPTHTYSYSHKHSPSILLHPPSLHLSIYLSIYLSMCSIQRVLGLGTSINLLPGQAVDSGRESVFQGPLLGLACHGRLRCSSGRLALSCPGLSLVMGRFRCSSGRLALSCSGLSLVMGRFRCSSGRLVLSCSGLHQLVHWTTYGRLILDTGQTRTASG